MARAPQPVRSFGEKALSISNWSLFGCLSRLPFDSALFEMLYVKCSIEVLAFVTVEDPL